MKLLEDVGFPPGVVNIVTGSTPVSGQALVESPDIDMVSFTGSTNVGMQIGETAGRGLKRQLLELGGKGGAIVFEDADLKSTIGMIGSVWAFHSGQICTAPTRAIVHRSVYDQVVGGLSQMAGALKVGDPLEKDTVMGPLITEAHLNRVQGYVASGREQGGEIVAGGNRPSHLEHGWYLEPTLIANCRPEMRVVREEIFGPVIVVVPFDEEEEAIAIANDTEFGLYDYVFSRDTAPRDARVSAPAGRQRGDQHGAAEPGDPVRRHQAQRDRSRRWVLRSARVHRAAVRRLARLSLGADMEFGIFHSGHVPTQRSADAQRRLEHQRLHDEAAVAVTGDRHGFKYSWFTEHHFLEEYSHVSASEVLMGYVAARTERIHLGSGIFNLTPPVNHPARVAERVSMIDHLSNGRFEFGTGRGSSSTEYQGFGIPDAETTRDLFDEALPEVVRILREAPYDYTGHGFTMPTRTVLPRPWTVPHPPLWLACGSPATFEKAGRLGMGALCFTMGDPEDLAPLIESYKDAVSSCTEPIGAYVNDNVATVSMLLCLNDRERAINQFRNMGASRVPVPRRSLARLHPVAGGHRPQELQRARAERRRAASRRSTRVGAASGPRRTSPGRSSGGVMPVPTS